MPMHDTATQEEYDIQRAVIDRITNHPREDDDPVEMLITANDEMLSPTAFCASMAYAAQQIPSVKDQALELRQSAMEHFMLPVGTKIVLTEDADRFPDFVAKTGATGTVAYIAEDFSLIRVLMDAHIPGAEMWHNHLEFRDTDTTQVHTSAIGQFLESCEALSRSES